MNGKLEKGFSLLEVMIALLVISIGALGLTKAQISALQTASDAGLRTAAAILVQDMAGRIQANAQEALNGNGYTSGTPAITANCLDATSGNTCTGHQMALQDVYEWQQLITNAFPMNSSPQPSISVANGVYTITFEDPTGKNKFDAAQIQVTGTIISPLEIISIDEREQLRKELFSGK